MTRAMQNRGGFSLIELLTVIAIIGILAALIFPIVGGARRKAAETQCISNMYNVFVAVKQFQLDERRYPEYIAGPAMFDGSAVIPLERTTGIDEDRNRLVSLYPEYINSVQGLRCPSMGLNAEDEDYTTSDIVEDPAYALGLRGGPFFLYKYSAYDWQAPRGSSDPNQVHYLLTRTHDMDNPQVERQLKWRRPPTETVITWCSYHGSGQDRSSGNTGDRDLVLFLDGQVRRISADQMEPWWNGWMVFPGN